MLAAYVLQVVVLGLTGARWAWRSRAPGWRRFPASIGAAFGATSYGLTASAVWQGVSVGLLVSLLFSLVPLLEVRRVKPLLLLRGGTTAGLAGPAGYPAWWTARGHARAARRTSTGRRPRAAMLVGRRAGRSSPGGRRRSLRIGLIVCAGFAGIALLLHLAAHRRSSAPCARSRARAGSRCATPSSISPARATRPASSCLAVGIGSFFVIGVRSLQANLLQQFSLELSSGGADMFLIEILPAQVAPVRAFLEARKARGGGPPRLIPVMRARVTGVAAAATTNLESIEDVRRRGVWGASTRSPTAITSRRTRRWSTARSGHHPGSSPGRRRE